MKICNKCKKELGVLRVEDDGGCCRIVVMK